MRHDEFEERDGTPVNPSNEMTIGELISRRMMLKGLAATGVFGLFGCAATGGTQSGGDGSASLAFTEIGRTTDDKHHVAPGYDVQVLMRQGDPIRKGAPQYRPGSRQATIRNRSSAPTTISSPTCRCRAARATRPAGCSA